MWAIISQGSWFDLIRKSPVFNIASIQHRLSFIGIVSPVMGSLKSIPVSTTRLHLRLFVGACTCAYCCTCTCAYCCTWSAPPALPPDAPIDVSGRRMHLHLMRRDINMTATSPNITQHRITSHNITQHHPTSPNVLILRLQMQRSEGSRRLRSLKSWSPAAPEQS